MKRFNLFFVMAIVAVIAVGCSGKKRVEGSEVPTQPQSTESASVKTTAPKAAKKTTKDSKYTVIKGDTLWDISANSIIYKDPFQWPLIFKANRDQIQDPDLIYPKQEFSIRKGLAASEIDRAKKDASATPKYVPHSKPRETLPVDYF